MLYCPVDAGIRTRYGGGSRRRQTTGRSAMTITVDIRPEVQAELASQAAAHGRPIEAYVASLLEDATRISPPQETALGVAEAENLFDLFAPVRVCSRMRK